MTKVKKLISDYEESLEEFKSYGEEPYAKGAVSILEKGIKDLTILDAQEFKVRLHIDMHSM